MRKRMTGTACVLASLLLAAGGMAAAAEGALNVTPTAPKPALTLTFDKEADKDYFWSEDYTTTTVADGAMKVTGDGRNWGVVMASSPDKLVLTPGKDYTVMMRYKSHRMTPEYQFVVLSNEGGKEIYDYCYRWGTTNFENHWSFQLDPASRNEYQWAGDFQHVKDGDYSIVALHFYTSPATENIYFKFQTCEFQAPKPLEFTLDTFRVFEGYANLSSAADLMSDSPSMPAPTATAAPEPDTTAAPPETTTTAPAETTAATTAATKTTAAMTTTAARTTGTAAPADATQAGEGNGSGFPVGIVVCIAVIVVVAGLGVGAYFFFTRKKPKDTPQPPADPA